MLLFRNLHVQIGDINTFRATNVDIDLGLMGHYWDYTNLPDQGRYILSIIDKKDSHIHIAVQATMVMKYATMDSIVEMYIAKGMQSIDAYALVFKGGNTEITAYGFRTPITLYFPTQVWYSLCRDYLWYCEDDWLPNTHTSQYSTQV